MSDTSYVYTDKLKLAQTKKIVNECMSLSSWKDVLGGEGGGIVNEDSVKLTMSFDKLTLMELPNIASFAMTGKSPRFPENTCFLLGGIRYALPLGSGFSKINFQVERNGRLLLPMPPRKGCVDGGLVSGDALLKGQCHAWRFKSER